MLLLYIMRKDKDSAYRLRTEGKSYNQIRAQLKIPVSTLSGWFKYDTQSQQVKDFLTAASQGISKTRIIRLNKVRGDNLKKIYEEAEEEARKEFKYLKYHPLFIAALMVYWGEGDKGRNILRVTNTDPMLLKVFIKFLKEICGVKEIDIKAHLLIYPDLDEKVCMNYWVEQLGHPLGNFNKTVVIQGRHKTHRLRYGVCHITTSSSYLKKKLLLWLLLLPEALVGLDYYKMGII